MPRLVVLALVAALAGCGSTPPMELAWHNNLVDHSSLAVRGPANFGMALGTAIGAVALVAALPVTATIELVRYAHDPGRLDVGEVIEWPQGVCAVTGCWLFGSLPHLVVGDPGTETHRSRSQGATLHFNGPPDLPVPAKKIG